MYTAFIVSQRFNLSTLKLQNTLRQKSSIKIEYIHTFRGLAILFIVAAHLIWATGDYLEIKLVLRSVLANTTILFLIISGFLFEYLSPKYKFLPFIQKKLEYVFLPYIVCSIPIITFLVIRTPEDNILNQIVKYILTGSHLGPFWYIPVIMVLFLISPLINYIKNFRAFDYCLLITLGTSLILPRPEATNLILNAIYYFGYFHLGIYLAKRQVTILKIISQSSFLIIISIVFIVGLLTISTTGISQSFVLNTHKIILAFLLLSVSYHLKNKPLNSILITLADYSFGIFFLHQYIINVFASLSARVGFDYTSLIYSIVIFPVVILTSMLVVYIIKLILPSYSRLIVGS